MVTVRSYKFPALPLSTRLLAAAVLDALVTAAPDAELGMDVTSQGEVLGVLPGCTVHVPDCVAAACTANVPVPTTVAFKLAAVACAAVTVPLTGCVAALPSTLSAPPALTVAELPPCAIVASQGVVLAVLPG